MSFAESESFEAVKSSACVSAWFLEIGQMELRECCGLWRPASEVRLG